MRAETDSLPLNRADTPPPPAPRDWILRVAPGREFYGQIISKAVWGVYTHGDGHTRECFKDRASCELCQRGAPHRWRGYLHAWNAITKQEVFLELTGEAVEELWRQVGKGTSLRGYILRVGRKGAGLRGRIELEARPPTGNPDNMQEERDPEETLRRLWQWRTYRQ